MAQTPREKRKFLPLRAVMASRVVKGGHQKHILTDLAYHADDDGRCFLKLQTIANECGISVRTVTRDLRKLVKDGIVRRRRGRRNDGRTGCNTYEIDLAKLETTHGQNDHGQNDHVTLSGQNDHVDMVNPSVPHGQFGGDIKTHRRLKEEEREDIECAHSAAYSASHREVHVSEWQPSARIVREIIAEYSISREQVDDEAVRFRQSWMEYRKDPVESQGFWDSKFQIQIDKAGGFRAINHDWKPYKRHADWATKQGLTLEQIDEETKAFCCQHIGKIKSRPCSNFEWQQQIEARIKADGHPSTWGQDRKAA